MLCKRSQLFTGWMAICMGIYVCEALHPSSRKGMERSVPELTRKSPKKANTFLWQTFSRLQMAPGRTVGEQMPGSQSVGSLGILDIWMANGKPSVATPEPHQSGCLLAP